MPKFRFAAIASDRLSGGNDRRTGVVEADTREEGARKVEADIERSGTTRCSQVIVSDRDHN